MKSLKNYSPAEIIAIASDLQKAITRNHSGKMEGIQSLSTSVLLNPQCKKNAEIENSVCSHCYASKYAEMRKALSGKLASNTELLTADVLPLEALPVITCLYFRFEAFGDLMNAVQVVNYFNIAKKNPAVNFALWTKNPQFIAEAIKNGAEKPDNLNIVYSSLFLNEPAEAITKKYSFIDKVFTVYDPATIEAENIEINCGSLHCMNCLKCYLKNDITVINEKLK